MKNKKGFTLVELLAVITILTILVLMAVPNVTKHVTESRKRAFVADARTIISSSRSNYTSGKFENTIGVDASQKDQVTYSKEAVNSILDKKLGKGPFNSNYKDAGVIAYKIEDQYGASKYEFYVCLIDEDGNGFDYTSEIDLSVASLESDKKVTNCTGLPKRSYTVEVVVNNGSVDEASKKVYDEEDVNFNLTPNIPDAEPTVKCTNNQNGEINNNVLTVSKVKANTVCTVTFSANMTVLYNDGTLIINEKPGDRSSNINKHGEVTKEYAGMSNSNSYVFNNITFQPWYAQRESIKKVEIGQKVQPTYAQYWFYGLRNMTVCNLTNLDTSNVTNMQQMFNHTGSAVSSFELIGLDKLDTSNVTNMLGMFADSNVDIFSYVENLDVSNVTNMTEMFAAIGERVAPPDIEVNLSNWDTSKVTNMSGMFTRVGSTLVYSASNESNMNTVNINLSNWDTSKVTDMSNMFSNFGRWATSFRIIGLDDWDTSSVTGMFRMFYQTGQNSSTFNIGNLSNWNTSSVIDMYQMFNDSGKKATTFNIGNLSNWDTSNVTRMNAMFSGAGQSAAIFKLDLSNWNTSKVADMSSMFFATGRNATVWNIGNLNNWDVSNVTNMQSMFYQAGYSATTWGIGDLSNWNTSKVINMRTMFFESGKNATTWSDIGTLNAYTTNIEYMFKNTPKIKVTFNIYDVPTNYNDAFYSAATDSNALITVNYSSSVTNIDEIIATKSSNSNVIKGVQLN